MSETAKRLTKYRFLFAEFYISRISFRAIDLLPDYFVGSAGDSVYEQAAVF